VAELTYERDASGNVVMKLPAALATRCIPLNISEYNDPVRAVVGAGSALGLALEEFLRDLSLIDQDPDPREGAWKPVLRSWRSVIYRAAETFEAYSTNLKGALLLNEKSWRKSTKPFDVLVKRHRDKWAFLANKMKHNGNELMPVIHHFERSLKIVHGYSLVQPVGLDAKDVNKSFHKGRERARSYDSDLRQLIYDILRVDAAAATIVGQIEDNPSVAPLPAYQVAWNINDQLNKISTRHVRVIPLQSHMFDSFMLLPRQLVTTRQTAEVIFEGSRVKTMFVADGITRSYPII
jgi:hypothetical protein